MQSRQLNATMRADLYGVIQHPETERTATESRISLRSGELSVLPTFENRSKVTRAPHSASFVATPSGATMFVGLYTAEYRGVLTKDAPQPHSDEVLPAGSCDVYNLRPDERSVDLEGRLVIEWGDGTLAWVQRTDNQNKPITELHAEFKEPEFPGFLNFRKPLSEVAGLPKKLDLLS
jgi:hypothetical protein